MERAFFRLRLYPVRHVPAAWREPATAAVLTPAPCSPCIPPVGAVCVLDANCRLTILRALLRGSYELHLARRNCPFNAPGVRGLLAPLIGGIDVSGGHGIQGYLHAVVFGSDLRPIRSLMRRVDGMVRWQERMRPRARTHRRNCVQVRLLLPSASRHHTGVPRAHVPNASLSCHGGARTVGAAAGDGGGGLSESLLGGSGGGGGGREVRNGAAMSLATTAQRRAPPQVAFEESIAGSQARRGSDAPPFTGTGSVMSSEAAGGVPRRARTHVPGAQDSRC